MPKPKGVMSCAQCRFRITLLPNSTAAHHIHTMYSYLNNNATISSLQEKAVRIAAEEKETVKKPNASSNSRKKAKNTPKSFVCSATAAANASATTESPVSVTFVAKCVRRFGLPRGI